MNHALHNACQDDALWKELAERKWGARVQDLAAGSVPKGGWQAWCRHRMQSIHLPPSPLALIQEHFHDPWLHIAACLLCSRTTGGPIVREAIMQLLARWPNPSALLDAAAGDVLAAMHPLGLQAQRYTALTSMSHDFIATNWDGEWVGRDDSCRAAL